MTGMDKKSKKPLRIKIISMGNAEVGKVRISLFCYLTAKCVCVCVAFFPISSYGYGRGTCEFKEYIPPPVFVTIV